MSEAKRKILVVDDERDLCEILKFNLESEGYEVETAFSAEEALKFPVEKFDLLILDVMMGEISGYRLADIIRKEKNLQIPIIFLTAKTTENDMLTGFNVGGDDFIKKPFSIKEVIARTRAILKRGKKTVASGLKFNDLVVDMNKKKVSISGNPVLLTKKEFDILSLLMQNQGKYITREEILNRVWNDDVVVTDRNVDVNIARLRKKIGIYGKNIKGKSGYGYLFEVD